MSISENADDDLANDLGEVHECQYKRSLGSAEAEEGSVCYNVSVSWEIYKKNYLLGT